MSPGFLGYRPFCDIYAVLSTSFSTYRKIFKIWSSLACYEELAVGFEPIRNGEIFWMNNITYIATITCGTEKNKQTLLFFTSWINFFSGILFQLGMSGLFAKTTLTTLIFNLSLFANPIKSLYSSLFVVDVLIDLILFMCNHFQFKRKSLLPPTQKPIKCNIQITAN